MGMVTRTWAGLGTYETCVAVAITCGSVTEIVLIVVVAVLVLIGLSRRNTSRSSTDSQRRSRSVVV